MRKKWMAAFLFVSSFLTFSLIISGMAWADTFKWPPMLRIATPTTQSASFASTNGWAPVLKKDAGVNVRIVPEDSELRRYMRFALRKEFEISSVSVADIIAAIQGTAGYKTQKAAVMRIGWFQNDTPWGFVVRGDSDFKTVYDLKKQGVKVAVSSQSPPMILAAKEALPAFLGWTPEEAEKNWTFVPAGSYPDNCQTIPDGRADVAYVTPISGITFKMEAHPKGLRWLSMPHEDKAGWSGYMNVRKNVLPIVADYGVKSAHGVEMTASAFLYATRPDVDPEMTYRMAKWFNEAFDRYKTVHAIAPRMALTRFRTFLNFSSVPVADGTIRYLKEIGQWTSDDDKWNQDAIALMDRWIDARNAAIDEADAKGVKIHHENEEYLKIFDKHTGDLPPFKSRI